MIQVLKNFIFWSRWLQAPLYLGLIVAQGVYVYQFMIELSHLVAKTGRLTDPDIERYGPIAALAYGPAYVDEVGILCDLNARYLGMTPLALAEWLVGDLRSGRLRARTA